MSTPVITPLNPLVDKIRSAHPGVYDDMDDATLTKKVLAKYPQYEDLARPASPLPGSPQSQPSMSEMAGTSSLALPAHGAGSLGPGQQEATPGMGTAGAIGLATGAGAAGIQAGAAALLPAATKGVEAIGDWAEAHPILAKMVYEGIKGATWYKLLKKASEVGNAGRD